MEIRNNVSHYPLDKKLRITDQDVVENFKAVKDLVSCLEELHHLPTPKAADLRADLDTVSYSQ